MSSPEHLTTVLNGVCAEIAAAAKGNDEVAERLVVVAGQRATVLHPTGVDAYDHDGVIAFVNDSGVPFAEQADELIRQVAPLNPEVVLLAGSALVGRPGESFRRVLAVQLFSRAPACRTARIADVEPAEGPIETIGLWKSAKPGPPTWAEKALAWSDEEG